MVEQKRLNGIAVDAVFDSVSVATTFKDELTKKGIIFCSISEAIQKHSDLVKKYLGSVIPLSDHYFATLNSAVFTDGSFVYIPPNTKCPMELSTYFRINASETGQFERTLIIADKGSYVSYLEGCTAPMRDENQLHAANVELVALDDAEIKYSTVQIGTQEMKKELVGFTILLLKEVRAEEKILKFHGLKLKPVQQLRGNTPVVFYKVITLLVNFIQ